MYDAATVALAAQRQAQSFPLSQSKQVGREPERFTPYEPRTLEETGLTRVNIEGLILKYLQSCGNANGREISEQVKLPFALVREILSALKSELLVAYKSEAAMSDYEYELTPSGFDRARRHMDRCTYFGAAPVPIEDYFPSVALQSIRNSKPRIDTLCKAFSDLVVPLSIVSQVGQALNSGRALFLYGAPGNGKTSIAERVIRAVASEIWIPRTISITGEIIRLYDPSCHEAASSELDPDSLPEGRRIDERWIRIKRPTIIVGGELHLRQLDFHMNEQTGINEAPIQLKSNGGSLVIDDFGRQQCSNAELLNRWIVPLEKGHDYLTLASGRQLQVPFDQFLMFATNLLPRDLVDEAFLRRIPYKIQVPNPSIADLHKLFGNIVADYGFEYDEALVNYLLRFHIVEKKRPLRSCLARDILELAHNFCEFHHQPYQLTREVLDIAVTNYYAGL
ncbi:MAG: putative ATPase with chaperone activity [Pirellulaceae bacterium]|jgi:predicted ATPase with chaperone activity